MKIVLYLFLLVILLIVSFSSKEGFETGKYAYLAPVKPYILDETTKQNFITAYNNSGGLVFPNAYIKPNDDAVLNQFKQFASLDEINYYIQNKKWPINSYVTNYIVTNKTTFEDAIRQMKINTFDDLYKIVPVRFIYASFIHPKESGLSPVPLSNDIFMGKQQAPVGSVSTDTIRPVFSSENYSTIK
jgi:hypothetical protein